MSDDTEVLHLKVLKAQFRYYKLRNVLTFIGITTVLATLVVSLLTYVHLNDSIDTAKQNTQTLIDCTTPKHDCYEQARSATSGAVGTIAKVTVATAFCIKNLDHGATQATIQSCVNSALGIK